MFSHPSYRCNFEHHPLTPPAPPPPDIVDDISVRTYVELKPTGLRAEALMRKSVDKGSQRARIEEPCPECDADYMLYHTAQLRSADEGQTVFYECEQCGHKYSLNS